MLAVFDFKNRILGFRWHVIAVRTLHYERFLTTNWMDDGQELDYIYLTDEEYYTSLVNNLPGTPGIAGSPRVIGLSISKEF